MLLERARAHHFFVCRWLFPFPPSILDPLHQLIILEIAGLLNPASSPLAWRVCLSLMVLALHVVLPFLFAFACLGELGLGR